MAATDDEERGEARLRVREVEAGEEEGDRRCSCEQPAPRPSHEARRARPRSRRELAPVHARVREERGDAEEATCTRWRPRGPARSTAPRPRLPDPDRGKHGRDADDRVREHARQPGRNGVRPTTASRPAKGKRKKASWIAPGAEVARPERRDGEKAHDRGRRDCDERRELRQRVAAEGAHRERKHRGREHRVERDEQERLRVADVDRDPERRCEQQRDRAERGPGDEERGEPRDEGNAHDGGARERRPIRHEAQVVGRHERRAEHRLGRPEDGEPGQDCRAPAPEEDERGAERSDERRGLGEVGMLQGGRSLVPS